MLHEQQSLRPTDAELRAKKARMHAKNQELDRELESVKADFHNSGLVNPMICRSLYKDYKYARKDMQSLLAEVNLLRAQRDRLSGVVYSLTKESR